MLADWARAAVRRSNILMNNGEMSDAEIRKYTIQSIWIAADNGEEYFLGSGAVVVSGVGTMIRRNNEALV